MPEYSYKCQKCNLCFSVVSSIKDYQEHPVCQCGSKNTEREYVQDCLSINGSVRKADSELKTIGDLAWRNTERMSDDQKQYLHEKNNAYKEKPSTKTLPKGMSRIPKPPKPKWR